MYYGFQGLFLIMLPNFRDDGLDPIGYNIVLPNNTILLVTIDKFDPNPLLVNINKSKPYKFIEDKTLQPVLVKPSDLVTNKPIQAKEPIPPPVELEVFQPIKFEPFSNHSTPNNIKAIDVVVHHYHNQHVQDDNVVVSNDPNNMFGKAFIDVYLLGVSNPKGCVHSQTHSHFYMK
jgi:hypothetical protein